MTGVQKKRRWVIDAIAHSSDSDSDSDTGYLLPSGNNKNNQTLHKTNFIDRLKIDHSLLGGLTINDELSNENEDLGGVGPDKKNIKDNVELEDTDVDVEGISGDKSHLCIQKSNFSLMQLNKSSKFVTKVDNTCPSTTENSQIRKLQGNEIITESSKNTCVDNSPAKHIKTEPEDIDDDKTKLDRTETDSEDDEATEESEDQTDESDDENIDSEDESEMKNLQDTDKSKAADGRSKVSSLRQKQLNRINEMMKEHLLRKSHVASYCLEGWVSFQLVGCSDIIYG